MDTWIVMWLGYNYYVNGCLKFTFLSQLVVNFQTKWEDARIIWDAMIIHLTLTQLFWVFQDETEF